MAEPLSLGNSLATSSPASPSQRSSPSRMSPSRSSPSFSRTAPQDKGTLKTAWQLDGSSSPTAAASPPTATAAEPWLRAIQATSEGASADWELPLPPVRFPLREALLSVQDGDFSMDSAEASVLNQKPALKVHQTEKSRVMKQIGTLRRHGRLNKSLSLYEEAPQPRPKPPPDVDRPRTPPRAVPSKATVLRVRARKAAEEAGSAWPILEESHSAPSFVGSPGATASGGSSPEIRETWSSAARAVLGHGKRFAGANEEYSAAIASQWPGASLQSYRHLPRPVKEWAENGMGFTDKGLGIGERVDEQISNMIRRSPGAVYDHQSYGNVALWSHDVPLPTRQPCAKYTSAEAHKMGARWKDPSKRVDLQQPCPGSYEVLGFTDELQRKNARRGRAAQGKAGARH